MGVVGRVGAMAGMFIHESQHASCNAAAVFVSPGTSHVLADEGPTRAVTSSPSLASSFSTSRNCEKAIVSLMTP